jgi:hypothetical protein
VPVSFSKETASQQPLVKLVYSRIGHGRVSKIKKHRLRATGGISPNISLISFIEFVSYQQYLFIAVEGNYASFLYCVGCKRGPPAGL